MARRKPDPVLQKVRVLARSGRRREASAVLQEAVQNNPANTKAREELARYLMGKPFSFEEVDYRELQQCIADFVSAPQKLGSMKKPMLRRLKHRSVYLERALEHLVTVSEKKALGQLRAAIAREMQRRRKPISKIIVSVAAVLSLLMLAGGSSWYLWQRAESAADILTSAANNFQREQAQRLLLIHDTGLNRTVSRRANEQADRLRNLIRQSQKEEEELENILRPIEAGVQTVVGLGVYLRAQVEKRLKALGPSAEKLQNRWKRLCRKEEKALNQQRLALLQELMAPLPEWQGLQDSPDKDEECLTARLKTLQQRVLIYNDAAESLQIPEDIIRNVYSEIDTHTKMLKEISALRQLLQHLPSVRVYEKYQRLLTEFTPGQYRPSIDLMSIVPLLPSEASVRGLMQEHGQNLPPGLLLSARDILVEGKPSFSPSTPATQKQLQHIEELTSNSALRTCLFELTNTVEGLEAYSEKLPELKYGRACFERSSLDPNYRLTDKKKVEWQNPLSVVSRKLDPRPLYKALGLENSARFIAEINLPKTITRVLHYEHPDVPPLAKAYVLHHLLLINDAGQHPILSGMRYAPEMRQAIQSFEKLREECHIKLNGSCWLQRTPAHAEAEKKFARWFHKQANIDFAGEVRRNLSTLMAVTPRFCGYINEHGDAVLFEPVQEGKLVWYLSHDAMTASAWGKPLQTPAKLSPVFTMEK